MTDEVRVVEDRVGDKVEIDDGGAVDVLFVELVVDPTIIGLTVTYGDAELTTDRGRLCPLTDSGTMT